MKIIIEHISDTHNNYDLPLKGGNLLIHSGDATMLGRDSELQKLNRFFRKVKNKYEEIIFVPGNHDLGFVDDPKRCIDIISEGVPNLTVLINEGIELFGIKIYGTPNTPTFGDWAFMHSERILAGIYKNIPRNTQLLISHGPPQGILDYVPPSMYHFAGASVGSSSLRWVIDNNLKELKLCQFGHIHESAGHLYKEDSKIHFINAGTSKSNYSRFTNGFVSVWKDGEVIDVTPN